MRRVVGSLVSVLVVLVASGVAGASPGRVDRRGASVPAVAVGTADEAFVTAAYTDFLGRTPSGSELAAATSVSLQSAGARMGVVDGLAHSNEWIGVTVEGLYRDTLGRDADAGGLAYWTNQLATGHQTVAQVAANFYASSEYFNGIGGGTLPSWVGDLYSKILHRDAATDVPGGDYWVTQAASKGRTWVALALFQSDESCRDRVEALYQKLLGRSADPGGLAYWAAQVRVHGDLTLAARLADSSEYYRRAWTRFGPHGLAILPPPSAQVPWQPVDIDDAGTVVGNDSTLSYGKAYRCSGSCTTSSPLALPSGNVVSHANGISAGGAVVGWAGPNTSGTKFPVVWSTSTDLAPSALQLPSGFQGGETTEVLGDGEVLGNGTDAEGGLQGLVWASVTAAPVVLAVPSGSRFSEIDGVTPSGEIVGMVSDSGDTFAVVWSSATDTSPTNLPVPSSIVVDHVAGVSSTGVIYGWGAAAGSGSQAMVWTSPSAQPDVLSEPSGIGHTKVVGVTDTGVIVGTGTDTSSRLQALVWADASDTSPRVLPVPTGMKLAEIGGVSAQGVIYATGQDTSSVYHGLVWSTPTAAAATVLADAPSPMTQTQDMSLVGMNASGQIIGTALVPSIGVVGGLLWPSASAASPTPLTFTGRLKATSAIGETSPGLVVGTDMTWNGFAPPAAIDPPAGMAGVQIAAMNNRAVSVGAVYGPASGFTYAQPAVWTDPHQAPTILKACATPSYSCNAWATGVSDSGEIVGVMSEGVGMGGRTTTLLDWTSSTDQTPTVLQPPTGLGALDLHISANGVIFGSTRGDMLGAAGVVVWPSSSQAPIQLAAPGYSNLVLAGVTSTGQIIGSGFDGTHTVGLVWSSATAASPTVLALPAGESDTQAMAVSSTDEIVGSADGGTKLVVWSSPADTAPTVIDLPGGYSDVQVNRVDPNGTIFADVLGFRYRDALVYRP